MNRPLAVVHGGVTVYRVARRPDAWRWPDWAHAGPDGTFGNRWDDPEGTYRVLYACSQRVGAFVETLARFRPSAALIAGLAAVEGEDHTLPPGTIPPTWLDDRCVGVARVDGDFSSMQGMPQRWRRSMKPWQRASPTMGFASWMQLPSEFKRRGN